MNEGQLIRAICKPLPKTLHQQSMTTASLTTNGTPDRYFDAQNEGFKAARDLWIEFKMLLRMPKDDWVSVAPVEGKKVPPNGHLTVLQARWITRRWSAGKNAFVVLGLPDRTAIVIQGGDIYRSVSIGNACPLTGVTEWIRRFCGV